MDVAGQAQAALAELEAYIAGRFPTQFDMTSEANAKVSFVGLANYTPTYAPTGETYTEFPALMLGGIGQPSMEAAIKVLRDDFDKYAEGRGGSLYWRVRPEVDFRRGGGWKSYMRLLISSRPIAPPLSDEQHDNLRHSEIGQFLDRLIREDIARGGEPFFPKGQGNVIQCIWAAFHTPHHEAANV